MPLIFVAIILTLLFVAAISIRPYNLTGFDRWIMRIGALLLSLFWLLAVSVALVSAAENPVPAPAEHAVAVKGYTSCPTEFNPDDLGWAMHEIKRVPRTADGIIVAEYKRVFSYFPDPEQRILVGLKKWQNQACVAELFSYGSVDGIGQKHILAVIRSIESKGAVFAKPSMMSPPVVIERKMELKTIYLLTEKGWEAGDDWGVSADYSEEPPKVVWALYRNGAVVASRALSVELPRQFFHPQFHQEPVE